MSRIARNKSLLIIVALLLITNMAMLIYFLNKPGAEKESPRKSRSEMGIFLKNQVGFSDDQMKEFEKRKQLQRDSAGKYFKDLNDTKMAFYSQLNQADADSSRLDTLSMAIGRKQAHIDRMYFRHFRDIRSLCTPQQQKIYDSLFPGVIRNMIDRGKRKR